MDSHVNQNEFLVEESYTSLQLLDSIELTKLLGMILGNLRRANEHSVEYLSSITSIPADRLNNIESGKYSPTLLEFYALAFALDIDPLEILLPVQTLMEILENKKSVSLLTARRE